MSMLAFSLCKKPFWWYYFSSNPLRKYAFYFFLHIPQSVTYHLHLRSFKENTKFWPAGMQKQWLQDKSERFITVSEKNPRCCFRSMAVSAAIRWYRSAFIHYVYLRFMLVWFKEWGVLDPSFHAHPLFRHLELSNTSLFPLVFHRPHAALF